MAETITVLDLDKLSNICNFYTSTIIPYHMEQNFSPSQINDIRSLINDLQNDIMNYMNSFLQQIKNSSTIIERCALCSTRMTSNVYVPDQYKPQD